MGLYNSKGPFDELICGGGEVIHGVIIKLAISTFFCNVKLITSNYNHCSTNSGVS